MIQLKKLQSQKNNNTYYFNNKNTGDKYMSQAPAISLENVNPTGPIIKASFLDNHPAVKTALKVAAVASLFAASTTCWYVAPGTMLLCTIGVVVISPFAIAKSLQGENPATAQKTVFIALSTLGVLMGGAGIALTASAALSLIPAMQTIAIYDIVSSLFLINAGIGYLSSTGYNLMERAFSIVSDDNITIRIDQYMNRPVTTGAELQPQRLTSKWNKIGLYINLLLGRPLINNTETYSASMALSTTNTTRESLEQFLTSLHRPAEYRRFGDRTQDWEELQASVKNTLKMTFENASEEDIAALFQMVLDEQNHLAIIFSTNGELIINNTAAPINRMLNELLASVPKLGPALEKHVAAACDDLPRSLGTIKEKVAALQADITTLQRSIESPESRLSQCNALNTRLTELRSELEQIYQISTQLTINTDSENPSIRLLKEKLDQAAPLFKEAKTLHHITMGVPFSEEKATEEGFSRETIQQYKLFSDAMTLLTALTVRISSENEEDLTTDANDWFMQQLAPTSNEVWGLLDRLKATLGVSEYSDIQTKLEELGLATEKELRENLIICDQNEDDSFGEIILDVNTVIERLQSYIEQRSSRAIRSQIYNFVASIDIPSPSRRNLARLLYRSMMRFMVLAPIIAAPKIAAAGFATGFIINTITPSVIIRKLQSFVNFFRTQPRVDIPITLAEGRPLLSLTPTQRQSMEAFAQANTIGQMRILALELLFTMVMTIDEYAPVESAGMAVFGTFASGFFAGRETGNLTSRFVRQIIPS